MQRPDSDPTDPRRHVVALLDHFFHQGPNGVHLCLVLELKGPSVSAMLNQTPRPKYQAGVPHKYPLRVAQKILVQTLQGLRFLHQNGIVHSDPNPGNILWTVPSLSGAKGDNDLIQDSTKSSPVKRKDGLEDPWAPRYIMLPQPLMEHVEMDHGTLKIADLGNGKNTTMTVYSVG